MKSFMDGVMVLLFVLFMVWIIRGYHAQKYESRYGDGQGGDGREKKSGEEDA